MDVLQALEALEIEERKRRPQKKKKPTPTTATKFVNPLANRYHLYLVFLSSLKLTLHSPEPIPIPPNPITQILPNPLKEKADRDLSLPPTHDPGLQMQTSSPQQAQAHPARLLCPQDDGSLSQTHLGPLPPHAASASPLDPTLSPPASPSTPN